MPPAAVAIEGSSMSGVVTDGARNSGSQLLADGDLHLAGALSAGFAALIVVAAVAVAAAAVKDAAAVDIADEGLASVAGSYWNGDGLGPAVDRPLDKTFPVIVAAVAVDTAPAVVVAPAVIAVIVADYATCSACHVDP